MKLVAFGQSHAASLARASQEHSKELNEAGIKKVEVFSLSQLKRYRPNHESLKIGTVLGQTKPRKVDVKLIELAKTRFQKLQECASVTSSDLMAFIPRANYARLAKDIEKSDPDFVLSVCRGNEFFRFCMVNFPQPIQIASQTDGTSVDAYTIPDEIIKSNLKYLSWSIGPVLYCQALCNSTDKPVIMLPPPPPIGDNEYIKKFPGAFKDDLEAFGPATKELRRRTYELFLEVLKEGAEDIGARFMDLPENIAEDGFLRPEFYTRDPVHANSAYGVRVLEHVATELKQASH